MAADFAGLASQLATLPADVSPYGFLRENRSSLYPDFADAFYACLTANAVLYAITLAFCLSALLGKVLLNGAWLFRLKPTASGRLVVPNATLFYTFWSGVYAAISIVSCFVNHEAFRDRGDLRATQYLIPVMWMPIYLANWAEVHSLFTSAYLSSTAANGRLSRLPAWTINAYCLLVPVAFLCSTQPLFARQARECALSRLSRVYAHIRYSHGFAKGFSAFLNFDRELAAADALFTSGDKFIFRPNWLGMAQDLQNHMAKWSRYCPRTYTACAVFLFITLIIFVPLAVTHIIALRKQISDAERFRRASAVRSALDAQFRQLKRTYTFLIFETLVVVLIATIYTRISLLMALRFNEIAASAYKTSIAQLLSLFAYATLGPIVNGLIAYRVLRPLVVPLYRSWLCSRAKRLAGPELVGHIQIITEIERHVDHEDACDIVALLKSSARREPRQFLVVDRNAEERGQDETMVQMDSFEKIEAKLSVKNALKEKLSMREERMTPTSPRSAVFLRPFRTPPSSPRSMKGV